MTTDASTGAGVSVIIACRNEQEMIARCVSSVRDALPAAEILVVDGGTDRTIEIVSAMAQSDPLIRPIRNHGDRGKGHAIKTGIAEARHDVIAQFDADLQFAATDLPALLQPVLAGECSLCIGSRFLPNSSRHGYKGIATRDFGNRFLASLTSCLTGHRRTDVTTGMKAWTREAIELIDFRDDAYSYEVEIIVRAHRLGLRVLDIPVEYASRTAGESMHAGSLHVAKAGLVIIAKSIAARFRS